MVQEKITSGQKNCNKFIAWVSAMDEMDAPNWRDFFYNNQLNKSKVARACGFDRHSFKQNPKLIKLLEELNLRLTSEGVYKDTPAKLLIDDKSKHDVVDIKDSAKLRNLKLALKRAQDENAKLSAELAKITEFKEVLVEMGLYK